MSSEAAATAIIDDIIRDIYARFSEPISIDDMARSAMYSRFHFSRVFREVTGVSPGQFLTKVRIQEAKRLLLTTSLTVKEITVRVGYSSVGTFSAKFKDFVGMSPTAYRDCAPQPASPGEGTRGRSGIRL